MYAITVYTGWLMAAVKSWPKCHCGALLLPMASSTAPAGREFWCQVCGPQATHLLRENGTWQAPEARRLELAAKPPTWTAYVMRDGSTSIEAALATMPAADMQEVGSAMKTLANAADRLIAHGRGAESWAFTKSGTVYTAHFGDDSRMLVAYQVKPRRKGRAPRPCSSCSSKLEPGTVGYQAAVQRQQHIKYAGPGMVRIRWQDIRLCSACVESAHEGAKKVGRFLVHTGGAGR